MKICEKFVLRQIADTWVVLPLADETVNFSGMMTLNDSGVLLWRALERGSDREGLISALTCEYDVSAETAGADVDEFIRKLQTVGCIQM